jgi:hypothetical protein
MNRKFIILLAEIVLLIVALIFFRLIRIQQNTLIYIALPVLFLIFLKFTGIEKKVLNFSKYLFFSGILIIILQQLPYFILGTGSFLTIPDNLDFYVPRIKMLIDEHLLMNASGVIPGIMDGVPRGGMVVNGFNIQSWIFLIFKPFYAYILNMLLTNLIAYCGMYLLLKKYLIKEEGQSLILWFVSLSFGLLPFIYVIGISIAGIPLLLYAILNIYQYKTSWKDFLIISAFPFYSLIAYTGFFIIMTYGIFALYSLIISRKLNISLWVGLFLLTTVYVIIEWGLLKCYLSGEVEASQRSEFAFYIFGNAKEMIRGIGVNFIRGYYHCASLHSFILLSICLFLIYRLISRQSFYTKEIKMLVVLLICNLGLSFLYGFYNSVYFHNIKQAFPLARTFEFGRIFWFQPVIWYICFAILLVEIFKAEKLKFLIPVIIVIQFSFQMSQKEEFLNNIRLLAGKQISQPTFRQYFAEPIFTKIKKYIDKPEKSYRIVNLAIPPAVTQYNGFSTLDGYMNIYSKLYKHKFRKVIAGELEKNPFIKRYYDDWGDKCYLFISEIDEKERFYITKERDLKIYKADIDVSALKELRCDFIFSAVEIMNSDKLKLVLLKKFDDPASAWDVYIYKLQE